MYIGAHNGNQPPINPTSHHTLQFIEVTFCHDRLSSKPRRKNVANTIIHITLKVRFRGAIHKHFIIALEQILIPKHEIKKLMKQIHQFSIKYLTSIFLKKHKTKQQRMLVVPPHGSHPPSYMILLW